MHLQRKGVSYVHELKPGNYVICNDLIGVVCDVDSSTVTLQCETGTKKCNITGNAAVLATPREIAQRAALRLREVLSC